MEQFAGQVRSITGQADGDYRVEILVLRTHPEGGKPVSYTLTLNAESKSIVPEDELAGCFDVFHENEEPDGLNPTLRRQWTTARIVDEMVSRLFSSNALVAISFESGE